MCVIFHEDAELVDGGLRSRALNRLMPHTSNYRSLYIRKEVQNTPFSDQSKHNSAAVLKGPPRA